VTQTPTLAPPQQPPDGTPVQPRYIITNADKQRVKRIQDAWKAYEGELEKPLKKMPDEPDDNVLSNRMQAVVDRGEEFLFGKELEISVEEGAPDEAQECIDSTWGEKEARIPLLMKLEMNGANAGQGFLRLVKHKDGSLRIVPINPAIVYVQHAPQDCEMVTLYCLEYCEEQPATGKSAPDKIYYREEISLVDPGEMYNPARWFDPQANAGVSWEIQHWTRIDRGASDTGNNWTPAGEPIAWPYAFPPLFSCQNLPKPNDFWGYPDVTPDLIGLNGSLNLVQSNINRTEKIYGNPILYGRGAGESIIDIEPGKVVGLPPGGELGAITITTDVANALVFANNVRSDIDEQSAVPGVATGRIADIPRGNISGIALSLLFMPLMKKTDKKRCLYGMLILTVSKAILVLSGMSGAIKLTLNWQNPLPNDDLASWQTAALQKAAGVSDRTIMETRGLDADEEMERNQAEDAQKITNFSRGVGLPPAPPSFESAPGQPPASAQGQDQPEPGGAQ
jgi:hypothetical protein